MKKFLLSASMLGGLVPGQGLAHAGALPVNGGWVQDTPPADQVSDSGNSPLTFTLTEEGVFSMTDAAGQTNAYVVTDDAFLVLFTSTGSLPTYWTPNGPTSADSGWADPSADHGQIMLSPGTYSFNVADGIPVTPPELWERVDQIPEPASMALLGVGMAGLGLTRRMRRKLV